ncbi:Lon protease [Rhizoctonia solani]|uniref:Lon protease n=1 Tax=Rhizoctonia solani TaxID=456999 RepID=A0A0K6G6J2_9AGAM|nr:Lon protease [Rhizoctonia solani]
MGDTPTRTKYTHTAEYRSAHVADARTTLIKDIPVAPEVRSNSLLDAAVPISAPKTLKKFCDKVISIGLITNPDSNPRWSSLPRDPNVSRENEVVTFEFFEEIFTTLRDICPGEPNVHCLMDGDRAPRSFRHNTSRPDGFLYLGKEQKRASDVRWLDVILPMEVKKVDNKENRIDDGVKVAWSMQHLMRIDARRRFVLGLTCENTKLRLWYNDRCDIVVSTEFDVHKDWRYLVRIMVSILLAPPDELGFDPDVELVPSDDLDAEPNYDITIRNSDTEEYTTYRTLETISEVKADSMVGPGTRVWKVRKLVDGNLVGPCYILKDTWMHEDREPEHTVLKEIREAQPSYAQHFLTPIDHGFAYSVTNEPDNTHDTLRRVELKPTNKSIPMHSETEETVKSARNHGAGHLGDVRVLHPGGHRDFRYLSKHPRQHYRIVFKEIGKPVHQLHKWTDVFIAIQGAWEGLYAMHLCGYVHRDVSGRNILLVSGPSGKRGVITDLEYAKHIDDVSSPHDVKTGTAQFMATEVAFVKHKRLYDVRAAESMLEPLPPFRHNPLHDVESIWWICIWMMFCLIPVGEDTKIQIQNYHLVFDSPATKQMFFSAPEFHTRTMDLMLEKTMVSTMYTWYTMLDGHYRTSYEQHDTSETPQDTIRIETSIITACYRDGSKCLKELARSCRLLSTTFVSLAGLLDSGSSTMSAEQPVAGPSTKATRRSTRISLQTTERKEIGSTKSPQPQEAGHPKSTTESSKRVNPLKNAEQQKRKLSVYVELPAPKSQKPRYAIS